MFISWTETYTIIFLLISVLGILVYNKYVINVPNWPRNKMIFSQGNIFTFCVRLILIGIFSLIAWDVYVSYARPLFFPQFRANLEFGYETRLSVNNPETDTSTDGFRKYITVYFLHSDEKTKNPANYSKLLNTFEGVKYFYNKELNENVHFVQTNMCNLEKIPVLLASALKSERAPEYPSIYIVASGKATRHSRDNTMSHAQNVGELREQIKKIEHQQTSWWGSML
jgi:hypothetical protein